MQKTVRLRRSAALLVLCAALQGCGSSAQYERNQRAMDDQLALGNAEGVNADRPNLSDPAPVAR